MVFGIHCNFFIVLSIRLKTCRSNVFFLFYKAPKSRTRLRDFTRLSNLSRSLNGLSFLHTLKHLLDVLYLLFDVNVFVLLNDVRYFDDFGTFVKTDI